MNLYHFVDPATKLVAYADKPETGDLAAVSAANPGFVVVQAQTGQPGAPRIFPGYLYHDGTFWAPHRSSDPLTAGNATVTKDQWNNLFTFDELTEIYNFQDTVGISTKNKRSINALLRYLDGTTHIKLTHPTITAGLDLMVAVGFISAARKSEILAGITKQ